MTEFPDGCGFRSIHAAPSGYVKKLRVLSVTFGLLGAGLFFAFVPSRSALAVGIGAFLIAQAILLQLRTSKLSRALSDMAESTRKLRVCSSPDEVLSNVADAMKPLLAFDVCIVFVYDEEAMEIVPVFSRGVGPAPLEKAGFKLGWKMAQRAAETLKSQLASDIKSSEIGAENREALSLGASVMAAPMIIEDGLFGVMLVGSFEDKRYKRFHLDILEIIASQTAKPVEISLLYAEAQQLANTDPITGMYNYRHFYRRLSEEIRKARQTESPLSLLFMDLDGLKRYNDKFGHLVGDDVIREFASVLKLAVREGDIAARYAGDEFVVLMPDTERKEAEKVAGRIKSLVEEHRFTPYLVGEPLQVTVTVGVASYPQEAINESLLIHLADRDMYMSKPKKDANG